MAVPAWFVWGPLLPVFRGAESIGGRDQPQVCQHYGGPHKCGYTSTLTAETIALRRSIESERDPGYEDVDEPTISLGERQEIVQQLLRATREADDVGQALHRDSTSDSSQFRFITSAWEGRKARSTTRASLRVRKLKISQYQVIGGEDWALVLRGVLFATVRVRTPGCTRANSRPSMPS
ncbi:hypothetical protein B0J14DRAFT_703992 [Halenospora varia]|nr:hypothetical protein B0J14DRAFT_703992 [Halenospora varia]